MPTTDPWGIESCHFSGEPKGPKAHSGRAWGVPRPLATPGKSDVLAGAITWWMAARRKAKAETDRR